MSQLALDGFDPAQTASLTERQAQALAIIRSRAPIRSEDLGATLRELRGLRESGAEFDAGNGREVAEALHREKLVRYVRREGWVPVGHRKAGPPSGMLAPDEALPF